MTRNDLYQQILALPVFDCHTHLNAEMLNCRNIWDIAHYFWFHRELRAAGYYVELNKFVEETADIEYTMQKFLEAYNLTRNTAMNWVVTRILKDLYGVELTDLESVKFADKKIRSLAGNSEFSKQTLQKANIRKIAVGDEKNAYFPEIPEVGMFLPRIDSVMSVAIERLLRSDCAGTELNLIANEIDQLFHEYQLKGVTAVTLAIPKLNLRCEGRGAILSDHCTPDEIYIAVLHTICRLCEQYHFCLQLFMGMESGWMKDKRLRTAENDVTRIHKLYGLFENYQCQFELVSAAELNNMDIVHAATIYPNVSVGGLWWFNYKPSIFQDVMQKRFESLPPSHCSLITSDAVYAQWSYGKVLLVKKVLSDFLFNKIEEQWISEKEALDLAEWWLYKSAETRYQERKNK